jgi:hypothetical protein
MALPRLRRRTWPGAVLASAGRIPLGTTTTPPGRAVLATTVGAAVGLASLAVAIRVGSPSLVEGIAVIGFLCASAWMFFSERYALTLAVLTLYLGLVDGYLKLKTGSEYATLARDVLLYAICLGLLARAVVRREEMRLPPYAGLLLVYLLLVVVQLANPDSGGLMRGVASLRPHIEFLPLFVLGYLVVRTKRELRGLLVLLVVIGAANGIVTYVQFGLTPDELADWGPGYAERLEGTGDVSARTFRDDEGAERVRPFGLGADSGQGGLVALLALPAAFALISLARDRWRWIALPLGFAVALGIVTSQGRTVMIGAVVTVAAYASLTVVARRLVPTLAGIALLAIAVVGATSLSTDSAGSSAFDRVEQIAPSRILESASEQRGSSIVLAPTYAVEYPFGAGLGTVGPAAAFARSEKRSLDGETEFNFLILELGVIGACAFLGLLAALIARTFRRLRTIGDSDVRASLAALAAPLTGMVVMFFGSVVTGVSPGSPYFWAVAGVLAYWLQPSRTAERPPPARVKVHV